MKRTVSKLLVALLMMTMVMALVSCGGGSKSEYVGTWHATEISAYGVTMTPEDAGMEFTMEIKDDGTITATTNGEDDGAGTWEETDSGINISDDTGETIDGTLEDGVLTINLYGVEIKMEKE